MDNYAKLFALHMRNSGLPEEKVCNFEQSHLKLMQEFVLPIVIGQSSIEQYVEEFKRHADESDLFKNNERYSETCISGIRGILEQAVDAANLQPTKNETP